MDTPSIPFALSPVTRRTRPATPRLLAVLLVAAAVIGTSLRWWWKRPLSQRLDVVFVIDATSSMQDEIDDVKASVLAIGSQLALHKSTPIVRFGAVLYRDIGDAEVVREVPITSDLLSVREAISLVRAEGGGDWREHLGLGLHRALDMEWDGDNRLIYIVTDAPAQTYADGFDVDSAVMRAKSMGVKMHVVGCSGLREGEAELRAVADATGGTFHHLVATRNGQHAAPDAPSSAPSEPSTKVGGAPDAPSSAPSEPPTKVGGAHSLLASGCIRMGSSLSVLDFSLLGSSVSLRSFVRLGSSYSSIGVARLGSSMNSSDFDSLHLGSSLSLRRFARLGASVAVLDAVSMGSSLAVWPQPLETSETSRIAGRWGIDGNRSNRSHEVNASNASNASNESNASNASDASDEAEREETSLGSEMAEFMFASMRAEL